MGTAGTEAITRTKAVFLLLIGAITSSFIAPVSRVTVEIPPLLLLCLASLVAFFGHFAYFRLSFPWKVFINARPVCFEDYHATCPEVFAESGLTLYRDRIEANVCVRLLKLVRRHPWQKQIHDCDDNISYRCQFCGGV